MLLRPELHWVYQVSVSTVLAIPVCTAVAIVRYNLLDIDGLISATAAYSVLGVLFLAALLTVVPKVSHAVSVSVGINPTSAQLIVSILLAVVLVPLQRRLRPRLDRLFFVERYALARGVQELLDDLARCTTPA